MADVRQQVLAEATARRHRRIQRDEARTQSPTTAPRRTTAPPRARCCRRRHADRAHVRRRTRDERGPDVHAVPRSRRYVLLLVAAAVLALPLSAVASASWPSSSGCSSWSGRGCPISSAGPLRRPGYRAGAGPCGPRGGPAIRYLPGRRRHVPADGLAAGLTEPRNLPGVTLAALAGLSLGAVIGPERR